MAEPEFELLVFHDARELGRFSLRPGQYVIGHELPAQIPLPLDFVSHEHARLTMDAQGGSAIEDMGSVNGTYVDSARVEGVVPLLPNQTIQIGPAVLVVQRRTSGTDVTDGSFVHRTVDIAPHSSPGPRANLAGDERYQIGPELAKGGMGAVLQALEVATRRTVAMKVMLADTAEDEHSRLRFIEEAQITAQLEHPNIVPVHELGVNAGGGVFYTMKRVQGITLQQVLRLLARGDMEAGRRYSLATLLTIFQKVCDAVAFAHARQVIHRDLKPSNIMVGQYGEVLVMDWGLAKVVGRRESPKAHGVAGPIVVEESVSSARLDEGEAFATMAGAAIGTPAYMSPEQARGEIDALDARSDLFSLGLVLYEVLTLQRPFPGRTGRDVMENIAKGTPARPVTEAVALSLAGLAAGSRRGQLPHLRGREVPAGLAAVALKAIAFEPRRRYQSLQAMQADITAYQNGFATGAERAGAWTQAKLFIRRNRGISIAVAAALVILAATSVGFTLRVLREKRIALAESRRAEENEKTAQAQRRRAEGTVLQLELSRGIDALDRDQPVEALAWLAKVLRDDPQNRVAGRLIISTLSHRNFVLPAGPPIVVADEAAGETRGIFLGEDELLVYGQRIPTQRRNLWTGEQVGKTFRSTGRALLLPGGELVLIGGAYGSSPTRKDQVEVWRIATGEKVHTLAHPGANLVTLSGDGSTIATRDSSAVIRIWDSKSFAQRKEVHPTGSAAGNLVLEEHGRWLANAMDGKFQIWDLTQDLPPRLAGTDGIMRFHPAGLGIIGSADNGWWLNSLTGERITGGRPSPRAGNAKGELSADGSRLLTSAFYRPDTELWDVAQGRSLALLRQNSNVSFAKFLPRDWRVLTVSGAEARLWSGRDGQPVTPNFLLPGSGGDPEALSFSPRNDFLVNGSRGRLHPLDVRCGAELPVIVPLRDVLAFSLLTPDGRTVISSSNDHALQFSDAASGLKKRRWPTRSPG